MIIEFYFCLFQLCVLLQNLNRKSITQDAVVQMGWRLEATPTKTGKRRVYNCLGLKVSLGGVASRKSDSPKGRTKDHTFVLRFKNGADSLIYTWKQATFLDVALYLSWKKWIWENLEFSVCRVEPVNAVEMTEDVGLKTGFKSKIIHNY